MNNAQENSYDKPDFWHGDNDSFTVYLKQAALDIKHLMATPNNIVFAAWGRWLARVILENHRGEAIEEHTPWDYSTRGRLSNESFDLTQYETVGDFLDNEFTGNTCATYCSGAGLAAETYADVFDEEFLVMYNDCVRQVAPGLCSPENSFYDDEVGDALAMEGVDHYEMKESFRKCSLQETFFRSMGQALAERNQERLQNETAAAAAVIKQEHLRQLAGTELPSTIEAFSGSTKWEGKNSKSLWNFLDALVEQHGAEKIAAALMFVRISTSNKVASDLKVRYTVPT